MRIFILLFDTFMSIVDNLSAFLTSPLLTNESIRFLDNQLSGVGVMEFLNISSFSSITPLWFLGAGIAGILLYNFISWLIDILP